MLAEFAVRRWQITLVAFLLFALLGINAFLSIPRSVDPHFAIENTIVTAVLPGADAAEIEETLARFKNQELIAIQVLDPLEQSFAVEGDLILTDAETNQSMRTFITRRVQQEYRDQMDEHAAKVKELAQSMKFSFHSVTTDQPIFDTIYEAVLRREK